MSSNLPDEKRAAVAPSPLAFSREALRVVVAQISESFGFRRADERALQLLTDLLEKRKEKNGKL